jgi:methylenetetrahydrofolate reductase (NADPH)
VLIDLNFLDINNVLALRGDAQKFDGKFIPEPDGNEFALDLVKQIADMNNGFYLDKNIVNGEKSNFCIGIAGYPEKHFEAPNLATDLAFAKEKVEAGADYIVTQMFFDNQKYFDFVNACQSTGINVPIVPGLKPITKRYQLNSIPRMFYINLPQEFVLELQKAKDDEAFKQVGIEWCIAQSKDLKAKGVPCIHYYTMGDSATIRKIVETVY